MKNKLDELIEKRIDERLDGILAKKDFEESLIQKWSEVAEKLWKEKFTMADTEIEEISRQATEMREAEFVGAEIRKSNPGKFKEILASQLTGDK